MSAAAGLHGDDARWQLCGQPDQCLSFHSPAQNNRARCVEADEATNVFAEINAKHRNLHDPPLRLSFRRTHNAGRRGGPFHKTAEAAPSGATANTAGVLNGRWISGWVIRKTRTPRQTTPNANKVPMLTSSPTRPIGKRPARIATTAPVISVVT